MKIKTQDLTGPALDWAVAKCEGKNGVLHDDGITRCIVIAAPSGVYKGIWRPTINWSQAGPIIEREKIRIRFETECYWLFTTPTDTWLANYEGVGEWPGPTPLIAAMRCYVASVLGDEVEIPANLI